MMTKTQHLLCKIAEEAAEVGQMAMKCQQFGLDEVWEDNPDGPSTNIERLRAELIDLIAVKHMLAEAFDTSSKAGDMISAVNKKQEKVRRYLKYSQELGMVEE